MSKISQVWVKQEEAEEEDEEDSWFSIDSYQTIISSCCHTVARKPMLYKLAFLSFYHSGNVFPLRVLTPFSAKTSLQSADGFCCWKQMQED